MFAARGQGNFFGEKARMNKKVMLFLLMVTAVVVSGEKRQVSTSESRKGIEITVYNSDMGFVKETREINVNAGENELQVADVAAQINPVTVHAKSIDSPDDFLVLEQNYEYDLISHQKLMEKYVGKTLKIIDRNEYKDRNTVVDAQLLSANDGEVYKIGNQIYLGHPGIKVLPELPENFVDKPTLIWKLKTRKEKKHLVEISYLTNGISWNADYVLVCSSGGKNGDLSGWVTINNNSGAGFNNAVLKLVAGNVNQLVERNAEFGLRRNKVSMAYGVAADAAPQFTEESIHEYHMYDLQRKTTLKNNQTKQISLLGATNLKLDKEYVVSGNTYTHYGTRRYTNDDYKVPVNVYVVFRNSAENGLKMPLPSGTVRMFTADSKGSQQFIGEDHIEHTPENEKVRLKSGEAFDIVAEIKQTKFKQASTQLYESEWKVNLRNHKNEAVTVDVVMPMTGNWKIEEANFEHENVDAFKVKFKIPVKKQGDAELIYKLRVGL